MTQEQAGHWEQVYRSKAHDAVSWYAPHLSASLRLIRQLQPYADAALIDVGGGESTLVDDLLQQGYRDLSVLDISRTAIDFTRQRLGARAQTVDWLVGDITTLALQPARYDLWHDRAVFHFLTDPQARRAYVDQVAHALRPGGHVVIATFGLQGPLQCSGLDVVRYDSGTLHDEFGDGFKLLGSLTEQHATPFGTQQQFVYCWCKLG